VSSILKALKKLEAEKARSQGGQVDLARDILRPSEARRANPLWLPLLILGLIFFGGLVGMALMSWVGEDASRSLAPQEPAPIARQLPDPPPDGQPHATGPQFSVPLEPAAAPAVTAPTASSPLSGSETRAPERAASQATPPPKVAPDSVATRPSLVVSGIVYQADPDSRIAVINDLPTMAGTRIEGVLVEEIRSDSVVFNDAGKRFEIFFQP
jgi:general secretion pathway protein B